MKITFGPQGDSLKKKAEIPKDAVYDKYTERWWQRMVSPDGKVSWREVAEVTGEVGVNPPRAMSNEVGKASSATTDPDLLDRLGNLWNEATSFAEENYTGRGKTIRYLKDKLEE